MLYPQGESMLACFRITENLETRVESLVHALFVCPFVFHAFENDPNVYAAEAYARPNVAVECTTFQCRWKPNVHYRQQNQYT